MTFTSKPGCPMCGIVNAAFHSQINSLSFNPNSQTDKPDVLWKDHDFTVYRETTSPVSSIAHIIIAFNLHVPSIYRLSPTDLPLLLSIKELGARYLNHFSSATVRSNTYPEESMSTATPCPSQQPYSLPLPTNFRIGFITPPFRDAKIPITGHLHAHAYVEPADLMGWWRSVAYSPVAWYPIDDLIAEIREETSNNRIRSSMPENVSRPIDHVPTAGTRTGHANGVETTKFGLGASDDGLEDAERTLSSHPSPGSSQALYNVGYPTESPSPNCVPGSPNPPPINIELVRS